MKLRLSRRHRTLVDRSIPDLKSAGLTAVWVRATFAAIGYMANAIDNDAERYANVARIALDAISAYAEDVKTGRQIQGA